MPQVMKDDAAVKRGPESVSRLPGFLTPSGQRDLKKFGLNERSMQDWLRLQAEKIAAQKVKFKQGMSWIAARPLYFATRRDTHSDIMCVTTTTRPSNITRCDDGSLPGDGFGLSVKEILAKGVTYGGSGASALWFVSSRGLGTSWRSTNTSYATRCDTTLHDGAARHKLARHARLPNFAPDLPLLSVTQTLTPHPPSPPSKPQAKCRSDSKPPMSTPR